MAILKNDYLTKIKGINEIFNKKNLKFKIIIKFFESLINLIIESKIGP